MRDRDRQTDKDGETQRDRLTDRQTEGDTVRDRRTKRGKIREYCITQV